MQTEHLKKDFEEQIRAHERLIYKVCHMYAKQESDRQDLFQEIVIQLWKAWPGYRGQAKMSTWLYRVSINTAITGLRKQKDFIQAVEPAALPDDISDISHYKQKEEQFAQMYAAIAQLNEIEKAVVMLYLEDRSYQEMEEILGINEGTLRVKMNRAKEKLRQITKNN